jgi:hypothetical protein
MTTKKIVESKHKPLIETIINTAALAMAAAGTNFAIQGQWLGFVLVIFAALLEFGKYWGRKHNYW